MKIQRQSNIELCRLFAIASIVLVHSLGEYILPGHDEAARPVYAWMYVCNSVGILGVNAFLLISGYFSVKSKKAAYANLLYMCFFYLLVRIGICVATGVSIPSSIFLFVSKSNWFVPMYIGLLLLSPVLNSYIDKADKRSLGLLTLAVIAYDVWSDWYPGGVNERSGFSMIHFIAMYFAGRYIGLHGVGQIVSRLAPVALLLLVVLSSWLTYYVVQHGLNSSIMFKLSANNSPFVITAAISLFLTFRGLHIRHCRLLNHCARSVLGILLFHTFAPSNAFLSQIYSALYDNYHGITLFILWLSCVLLTMAVGIAIDQIRIYTYDRLFVSHVKE